MSAFERIVGRGNKRSGGRRRKRGWVYRGSRENEAEVKVEIEGRDVVMDRDISIEEVEKDYKEWESCGEERDYNKIIEILTEGLYGRISKGEMKR